MLKCFSFWETLFWPFLSCEFLAMVKNNEVQVPSIVLIQLNKPLQNNSQNWNSTPYSYYWPA